jgi:hypothetical protein
LSPLPAVGTIPLLTREVVRHPRARETPPATEAVLHPKEKAVRLPATKAAPHPATEVVHLQAVEVVHPPVTEEVHPPAAEDHIQAEEALHTTAHPEEYDAKSSFFSSKIHEL